MIKFICKEEEKSSKRKQLSRATHQDLRLQHGKVRVASERKNESMSVLLFNVVILGDDLPDLSVRMTPCYPGYMLEAVSNHDGW